jgi:hypothetical protein
MAKWTSDDVLDAALDALSEATLISACTTQPTTRTEAVSTYMLANATLASTDFTKADGDISGRKVTIATQSNVTISSTGTITHVAISSSTALLHVATCATESLTSGNTVTFPAFDIEFRDPS